MYGYVDKRDMLSLQGRLYTNTAILCMGIMILQVVVEADSSSMYTPISVSTSGACARFKNQAVRCWGDMDSLGVEVPIGNTVNEMRGDGVSDDPWEMTLLPFLNYSSANVTRVIAISKGGVGTAIINQNYDLLVFGRSFVTFDPLQRGQDVYFERASHLVPLQFASTHGVTQVNMGTAANVACAVFSNGRARCWGRARFTNYGVFGQGTLQDWRGPSISTVPFIQFSTPHTVTAVSTTEETACGLFSNGGVRCWGMNDEGQLGIGHVLPVGKGLTDMSNLQFIPFNSTHPAIGVTVGDGNVCALFSNSRARCWGKNLFHSLGQSDALFNNNIGDSMPNLLPSLPYIRLATTVEASEGQEVAVICTGGNYACLLTKKSGKIICWGQMVEEDTVIDSNGDLNKLVNRKPMPFSDTIPAASLACSPGFACAVFANGRARCWGSKAGSIGLGQPSRRGSEDCCIGSVLGDIPWLPYITFRDSTPIDVPALSSRCSDGVINPGMEFGYEECDDGNLVPNDGCDQYCKVEPGWTCKNVTAIGGSLCFRCGNAVLDSSLENCDDGNAVSNDGCSDTCQRETGWICNNIPSECSRCGDGLVEYTETCEDGNTVPGDGCNQDCTIEAGWTCNPPTKAGLTSYVCERCGNGILEGTENNVGRCEDGNVDDNDGCDSDCNVETSFNCVTVNGISICNNCGNGLIEGNEGCDDFNKISGDGCSANCQLEPFFQCSGEPTVCARCGNGILERPSEECDDKNVFSGDGCSNLCGVEAGFVCHTQSGSGCEAGQCPSVCQSCGNGVREGTEGCDDLNKFDNDGCSSSCAIEPGYQCIFGTKSTGPSLCYICGNGILDREGGEECDDGNTRERDGCSASCAIEIGWDCPTQGQPCKRKPGFAAVDDVVPLSGPATGGTSITVQGRQLFNTYCVFGNQRSSRTQIDQAGNRVVCAAPAQPSVQASRLPQSVAFRVETGTNDTIPSAVSYSYLYFIAPNITSVSPRFSYTAGNTTITVGGGPFHNQSQSGLVLGQVTAPCTYHSVSLVLCVTPFSEPTIVSAAISHNVYNGIPYDYSISPFEFRYRLCPPGTMSNSLRDPCTNCSQGYYQSREGQSECIPCENTRFNPFVGQSTCTPCPDNTASVIGARNQSECVCTRDNFHPMGMPGQTCTPCPLGASCSGSTVLPVPLKGFWTPGDELLFFECANKDACPGGGPMNCTEGYTGRLCGLCSQGHFRRGDECVQCPDNARVIFVLAVVFGLGVCIALIYIVRRQRSQYVNVLSIASSFLQVVALVVSIDLKWPKAVRDTVSALALPFNMNVDYLASECSVTVNYRSKWAMTMLIPPFFAGLFVMIYGVVYLFFLVKEKRSASKNTNTDDSEGIDSGTCSGSDLESLDEDQHIPSEVPARLDSSTPTKPEPPKEDKGNSEHPSETQATGVHASDKNVSPRSTTGSSGAATPVDTPATDGSVSGDESCRESAGDDIDGTDCDLGNETADDGGANLDSDCDDNVGVPTGSESGDVSAPIDTKSPETETVPIAVWLNNFRSSIVNAFCMLMTLLYLVLASNALSFFDCTRSFDGSWFLDAAPALLCYTDWWYKMLPVVILAVALYVVGIPVALVYIIHRYRHQLYTDKVVNAFGTLFAKYSDEHAYWEAIIMLRKLLLVVARSFFGNFSSVQVLLGMATIAISLNRHTIARPFIIDRYNQLESALLYASAGVMMSGLLFVSQDFQRDSGAVSVLTFLVIFIIVVCCIALFVVLIDELRRQLTLSKRLATRGLNPRDFDTMKLIFNDFDVVYVDSWLSATGPLGTIALDEHQQPSRSLSQEHLVAERRAAFHSMMSVIRENMQQPHAVSPTHPALASLAGFTQNMFRRQRLPVVLHCLLTEGDVFCGSFISTIRSLVAHKFAVIHKKKVSRVVRIADSKIDIGDTEGDAKGVSIKEGEEHRHLFEGLMGTDHMDSLLAISRNKEHAGQLFRLLTWHHAALLRGIELERMEMHEHSDIGNRADSTSARGRSRRSTALSAQEERDDSARGLWSDIPETSTSHAGGNDDFEGGIELAEIHALNVNDVDNSKPVATIPVDEPDGAVRSDTDDVHGEVTQVDL